MLQTRELKTNENDRTVVAAVQTDPGCVREANEDSGLHVNPNNEQKGTLTIVADGMGGHASGEVASKMAIELISELYYNAEGLAPGDALRQAIELANERIYETSLTSEEYFGMGTTVIALVLMGDVAFCAHVGDSRLYRFRGGKLEMMTLDHSQVMEMVKAGIITMEQARNHDDKNVILRAVGTQPSVEVELSELVRTEIGDTFLLCSDGLSDMIEDSEIESTLLAWPDAHTACEKLIEAAKLSGGHDNITAGIVRITEKNDTETSRNVRVTREIAAEDSV